jgi:MFS transporter, NNP family, nitrate/nitrite transporter
MISPLVLFKAPEINPINKKAKSIPALNPINVYGRVFTFSWVGFFLAFLSWYVFVAFSYLLVLGARDCVSYTQS